MTAGRSKRPRSGSRSTPRRSASGGTGSSPKVTPAWSTGRRRPQRSPNRTARRRAAPGASQLRTHARWGADRIAHEVGLAPSTVQSILNAAAVAASTAVTGPPREPVVRYQRERPGELIHVDVKKIAAHPCRRRLADCTAAATPRHHSRTRAGYRYIHSALDDRTRLVYSEILDDEQAVTAVGFWHRAVAWFAAHGIRCRTGHHRQRHLLQARSLAGRLRRHRHHRQEDPTPPPPDQRQDRALPPDPPRGMGLHPALDLRKPNATPATPASSTSTITTVPTAPSAGQHPPSPPTPSGQPPRRAHLVVKPGAPAYARSRCRRTHPCVLGVRSRDIGAGGGASRFASRRRPRHYRVDDGVGLRPGHDNHDSHHEHHDLVGMWRSGLDDAVCARSAPGSTGGDVQRPTPTDHRPPRRSRE